MNSKTNDDICNLLIKGYFAQARDRINSPFIDLNQTDHNRRTPLILCAFIDETSWAVSLLQILLQFGADINRSDSKQLNVVHYCVIFEQVELLKLLLESIDFNINNGDCYGNSPLIYAIVLDNEIITNMLIEYYQRYKIDIDKTNLVGINAFMQACLRGNLELMATLEDIGIDKSLKDFNGKSSLAYKENALAKAEFNSRLGELRRKSRMVKFCDVDQMAKLQRETTELNVRSIPETIDHNFHRINQLKTTLKKIKRHKIDTFYDFKKRERFLNIPDCRNLNVNLKIQQIRPQTAFSTSRELRSRNDWYSFLGPLYANLEQQYSTSFKNFTKSDIPIIDVGNCSIGKPKGRQRRSSRSSQSGRCTSNDDASVNGGKSRKKLESTISAKQSARHLSRIGGTNVTP